MRGCAMRGAARAYDGAGATDRRIGRECASTCDGAAARAVADHSILDVCDDLCRRILARRGVPRGRAWNWMIVVWTIIVCLWRPGGAAWDRVGVFARYVYTVRVVLSMSFE